MAEDDMDFESFGNLDDLDWSELEKDLQESKVDSGEEEPSMSPPDEGGMDAPASSTAKAQGPASRTGGPASKNIEISYLLDVNLQVMVEVGKTLTNISDILSWDRGSIVELEKLVGQSLNLLVNNKAVAKGEVVVVNEKFALKITEILDPKDRLNYLQS